MLYKVIKYHSNNKGENVVTYGEFGTTFYILVKGSVAVRIPALMEKEYTFKQLLEAIVENKDWLILNEKTQVTLYLQHVYIVHIWCDP